AQTKYLPEWFYYYGGLADKICGAVVPSDRPDHFTYTLKEPVGVCAFITPWNSPLMLVGWKLAPALAAGCTVVIKPSEFTTASLLLLQESIHDQFVEKLVAMAKQARLGDPSKLETQVGPVTTPPQYAKILSYIDIAKGEGAKCVLGGGPATKEEGGGKYFV